MQKTLKSNIRRRLLQWVMNAALVLSVLSFSGHVSQPGRGSIELTRTEMAYEGRNEDRSWTRIRINYDVLGHFASVGQPKNFTFRLFHCDLQIDVKLKGNPAPNARKNSLFFMHFFIYSSESSISDSLIG